MRSMGAKLADAARVGSGTRVRFALRLSLFGLIAPLVGCNATGDFGRPQPGAFQSSVPVIEERSGFALTEDERELRARAWRFLNPDPDLGAGSAAFLAQLHFHRRLPPGGGEIAAFHTRLMSEDFRSLVSRYQRLRQAIDADHDLIYPFRLTAVHVRQADLVRERALEHVWQVSPERESQALARICDNAAIVARVHGGLASRTAQYRYALENLLIEGPERAAIGAERSLAALEADLVAIARVPAAGHHCLRLGSDYAPAITMREAPGRGHGIRGK